MKASEYKQLTQPRESTIQTEIIGYLQYLGFYVQRMNSGVLPMFYNGKKRIIRMTKAGTPDILAFREVEEKRQPVHPVDFGYPITDTYTQLLFIEVKRPGNKPTILQSQVMQELEEHGARCFVATSVEDVEQQLAK